LKDVQLMDFEDFFLIAIPLTSWLLIRRFVRSLLVSVLIGLPFLWLGMIREEMLAPASDSAPVFVLAMVYRATLLAGSYAMVVTTLWALRCISRGEGASGAGQRCDGSLQWEPLPPAAGRAPGVARVWHVLRTMQRLAPFAAAIAFIYFSVAMAVEFGAMLGALGMLAMYSVAVLVVAVNRDALRAWAFASITPALVPPALLAVALIVESFLPFEPRTSQPWADTVNTFHLAFVMASGPLGIVVSLLADRNFPHDENWLYGALLAGTAGTQWYAAFRVGKGLLGHARNPRVKLVVCLAVTLAVLVLGFCLHLGVLIAKRS